MEKRVSLHIGLNCPLYCSTLTKIEMEGTTAEFLNTKFHKNLFNAGQRVTWVQTDMPNLTGAADECERTWSEHVVNRHGLK
jgi:hypothetical protein